MTPRRIATYLAIIILPTFLIWKFFHDRSNPYEELKMKWSYGATTTVPTLVIWAEHNGKKIDAPIMFHSISDPTLKFIDFDGDGTRDIVYTNGAKTQAMSFLRSSDGIKPPQFKVLKNDVYGQ